MGGHASLGRAALLVGAVVAVASRGSVARAGAPDQAAALFDKGLADMQAHKFETACPALSDSYKLDPHPGGLFTLAECEYEWGKITAAIADYDTFLDLVAHLSRKDRAKQEERVKIASEKRASLARDVPTLTVTVDAAIPAGATVKIDGQEVTGSRLGSPIQEDPGDHVITVQAADGRKNEQHVSLAKQEVRAVALSLPPLVPAALPAPQEMVAANDPAASRRRLVLITGGVGLAGLVAGGVLGAIVVADKSSIDKNCPTATTCATPADASSANSARTLGWASTGAFIGGGAALGAAAILWFTRPKAGGMEPVVAPAAGGVTVGVRGAF